MPSTLDTLYSRRLKDVADQAFDYVVVGAGAYGTSFAHRVLELAKDCRVLVLDKGGFLLPNHIQNLPPAYVDLNQRACVSPWEPTGGSQFMPQVPHIGGRALFWNAWTPQPSAAEMPCWPESCVRSLDREWYDAGVFVGRRFDLAGPGNDNADLAARYRERLFAGLNAIETSLPTEKPSDLDSSMAIGQGVAGSGWSKFCPVQVLVADLNRHPDRLQVVSHCEVERFVVREGRAAGLETAQGPLPLGAGTRVILALSSLEAGALAVKSLPGNPLAGKNLSGHFRSWLAFRVHKDKVRGLADRFQASAFYLPGQDPKSKRFLHTHVSVVFNPRPDRDADVLYRTLPDASTADTVRLYNDPDHVIFNLHAMGEFLGQSTAASCNYVTVKDGKTVVNVSLQPADYAFWSVMDTTLRQVVDVLAGGLEVEYQQQDGPVWGAAPPANLRNHGLVHESGTLWMGTDPKTSVSDVRGALHDAPNVFGTGGMLFPRPGSWNPTFTGIAMAFALARHLLPPGGAAAEQAARPAARPTPS